MLLWQTLLTMLFYFGPIVLFGYLCGCINGAIIVSRLLLRDDVRRHGSGNAGLTNFYRTYGGTFAPLVIILDMGKAFFAVGFASLWLTNAIVPTMGGQPTLLFHTLLNYVAGLSCVIGHMFPAFSGFKGGKGILCSATLLLALDWRVAVIGWGLFFLCVILFRYISLGSVLAAVSFPVTTYFFYDKDPAVTFIALLTAALVIFAHRENILRLCQGTEHRFAWKK